MDKNESDVILIVRSPYHTIPDIEVSCMEHWTLGMLKEHLFHVYPGNPVSPGLQFIQFKS